jgi:hypothetical protein
MPVKAKRSQIKPLESDPIGRTAKAVRSQSRSNFALERLDHLEFALREATSDVEDTKASLLEMGGGEPGITVVELASRSDLSEDALCALEDALVAFAETLGELLRQDLSISVEAARRGALLAVASQVWENELGPLLGTADVRELLGVSRQRVDELLRSQRLIALSDSAGKRQYPAFQFHDGQPLSSLIAAFWTVAETAISPWTAAAWCTAPDNDALDGLSPVAWARDGRDATHLALVARQDAARLEQ